MNRPMRWAVVIVGLAAELAFLVALDGLGVPRWAVWLCVVPAVFVAEAYLLPLVRRPRVPDRPARDPGRFMVSVTDWGRAPIQVLKAVREEDGDARAFEVLSRAMHGNDTLIVRTGLSGSAASQVARALEGAGAVVAIEHARG